MTLDNDKASEIGDETAPVKFLISLKCQSGVSLNLHVMQAGSGPPLIMVPATISELENWVTMVRFMAQWFTVYFFELPGHGKSEPFPGRFTTDQVAELIEQLADAIHTQQFSLMGFSFGGILAMKAFQRLSSRIDRLILIAPCLTHRALCFSPQHKTLLIRLAAFFARPLPAANLIRLMHSTITVEMVVAFLRLIGRLEDTISANLKYKFLNLPATTLDVLTWQLQEALSIEFSMPAASYATPCYFAMSYRDPLLSYKTTLEVVKTGFRSLHVTTMDYPFHQPPRPFTIDELNRDFSGIVIQAVSQPAFAPV